MAQGTEHDPEQPTQIPPPVGEEPKGYKLSEKQPADQEEAHPFEGEELSAEEEPPEVRGASSSGAGSDDQEG